MEVNIISNNLCLFWSYLCTFGIECSIFCVCVHSLRSDGTWCQGVGQTGRGRSPGSPGKFLCCEELRASRRLEISHFFFSSSSSSSSQAARVQEPHIIWNMDRTLQLIVPIYSFSVGRNNQSNFISPTPDWQAQTAAQHETHKIIRIRYDVIFRATPNSWRAQVIICCSVSFSSSQTIHKTIETPFNLTSFVHQRALCIFHV